MPKRPPGDVEQPTLFAELQPQSATKHDILEKYVSAWAGILSKQQWCRNAWVIDAFAGPGRYGDGNPGSPLIIAEQLARWQAVRAADRPHFRFRLRLIEPDHRDELAEALLLVSPELDVRVCDEPTFRDALPGLIQEIGDDPALYFIDPAGWSGAEFDLVEEALKGRSKEVLINFLYDRLNEWAGAARQLIEQGDPSPKITGLVQGITSFFGTSEWIDVVLDEPGPRVREARLLDIYAGQLRKRGTFAWSFRNKYPGKNRTYYYLIHATKKLTGLKIMKELMINADIAAPTLFDEMDFEASFEKFKNELHLRFGGGGPTPEDDILSYVLQDTEYLSRQMERGLTEIGATREEGRVGRKRLAYWRIP